MFTLYSKVLIGFLIFLCCRPNLCNSYIECNAKQHSFFLSRFCTWIKYFEKKIPSVAIEWQMSEISQINRCICYFDRRSGEWALHFWLRMGNKITPQLTLQVHDSTNVMNHECIKMFTLRQVSIFNIAPFRNYLYLEIWEKFSSNWIFFVETLIVFVKYLHRNVINHIKWYFSVQQVFIASDYCDRTIKMSHNIIFTLRAVREVV